MKNCTDCIHAQWVRTASGRLHPSGDGMCSKKVSLPPPPAAYYWLEKPRLGGGHINRRKDLQEHCPYFTWNPEQ